MGIELILDRINELLSVSGRCSMWPKFTFIGLINSLLFTNMEISLSTMYFLYWHCDDNPFRWIGYSLSEHGGRRKMEGMVQKEQEKQAEYSRDWLGECKQTNHWHLT